MATRRRTVRAMAEDERSDPSERVGAESGAAEKPERPEEPEEAKEPENTEQAGKPEDEQDSEKPSAVPVVEALLYASGKPATAAQIAEAAELEEADVEAALAEIEASLAGGERGIRLDRVAGGVRLVSRPEFDYPVRRLLGLEGRTKLSMAALETLAIIAYRQPVTAPEVMELRGVNSSSSLRTLLDRKLITTAGRKEVVGTPFLYKTTREFLVHFGLNQLSALPKPEELEAIYGLEVPPAEPAQVEMFPTEVEESPPMPEGEEGSGVPQEASVPPEETN